MAFKEPRGESGIKKKAEFVESASGENLDSKDAKKDNKLRMVSLKLPPEVIERVKRYQKSDMAKRVDTQSYIFEQAVMKWLDERGFEK